MKKIATMLLAGLVALTACGQDKKQESNNMKSKTLVTYFSATGTTAAVARNLAQVLGADIKPINPEKPYTDADLDWTNKQSRSTVEMKDKQSRPAIKKDAGDLSQYTTVYVGFPIWWYTAPTIVNTFLESYPLQGKHIYLFATSGGSDIAKAVSDLRKQYPSLHIEGGRLLNGASKDDLSDWTKNNK